MKKIISVMLVCVMLIGAIPFASAHGGHVRLLHTTGYCPVCASVLNHRTYDVELAGSGDVCRTIVTYRQANCLQHGNVYGVEELSSCDYRHDWITNSITGTVSCEHCGAKGTAVSATDECPSASVFHHWTTNFFNGGAKCTLCGFYLNKPLSQKDAVCPNHKTFHTWTTDYATGGVVCTGCGCAGTVKIAG